jgi:uncharacterized protein YjbI with pentapeptide repeats
MSMSMPITDLSWWKIAGAAALGVTASAIPFLRHILADVKDGWSIYKQTTDRIEVLRERAHRPWKDRQGAELFSEREFIDATSIYIRPDCQRADPSGNDDSAKGLTQRWPLFSEIDEILETGRDSYLILLADTGMGKTSFVINYYKYHHETRKRYRFDLVVLPLGKGRGLVDTYLANISEKSKHNTVVFLDAFDEDSDAIADHRGRLCELVKLCAGYRAIVVTCRTQFFPNDAAIPIDSGTVRGFTPPGSTKGSNYTRRYLSSLSDAQVKECLKKKFPARRQEQHRMLAEEIVKKIPELMARPMILANVEDLVGKDRKFDHLFQIYEEIVKSWLDRETAKSLIQETDRCQLEVFCERLALDLHPAGAYPGKDLEKLAQEQYGIPLKGWQLRGRSLLTRDADGNYKFSHKSFLEFLVARRIVTGEFPPRGEWSALTRRFIAELLRYSTVSPVKLRGADLTGMDLRGADLKGAVLTNARLRKTDLRGAQMNGADLTGADLTDSDLRNANLRGALLRHSIMKDAILLNTNLVAADFSGAQMGSSNIRYAHLPETSYTSELVGADLRGLDLSGKDFCRKVMDFANLESANLAHANLEHVTLVGANLSYANLEGANLWACDLTSAVLRGANLALADLGRAILIDADLSSANLSGANLQGTNLNRANTDGAIFH